MDAWGAARFCRAVDHGAMSGGTTLPSCGIQGKLSIYNLKQDWGISIANEIEISQSCTKSLKYHAGDAANSHDLGRFP